VILGVDFVREELVVDGAPLQYKQLEGGFTQPNAGISVQMLQWAKNAAVYDDAAISAIDASTNPSVTPERRADDFLELYCGNGNFTVAMAPMFRRVLATEVSKVSVAAAKENLVANGVANVDVVRLSSEELTRALDEGKSFERLNGVDLSEFELKTVLVDPPRAGMGTEVTKFVSRFGRIVYISCNPQTLAEDVRALALTHEVRRFAVFDQFPYTPHLECGALLVAKDGSIRS
jgi:tRNA (uracil-5-)-methyltransferase